MCYIDSVFEKPLRQVNFRVTDKQHLALHKLAQLHGLTTGELLRKFIEDEWTEEAEAIKTLEAAQAMARKKKRAA